MKQLLKDVRDWVQYASMVYMPSPATMVAALREKSKRKDRRRRRQQTQTLCPELLEPRLVLAWVGFDNWIAEDSEGNTVQLAVSRHADDEYDDLNYSTTVWYSTSNGTATGGVDFDDTGVSITFQPYETLVYIEIDLYSETIPYDEYDENFFVTLDSASGGASIGWQDEIEVVIWDTDDAPNVFFGNGVAVDDVIIDEDEGTASFTVHLENPSAKTVTVYYAFNLTAESPLARYGIDYSPTGSSVVFQPGETCKQIVVNIEDDGIDEYDEDFYITLDYADNATVVGPEARGVIVDNDDLPIAKITVDQSSFNEGHDATFTVELSGYTEKEVIVYFYTTDITAGGDDYTQHPENEEEHEHHHQYYVVFESSQAGQSTRTQEIRIATTVDGLHEGNEDFRVTICHPEEAELHEQDYYATATIADIDPLPTISIDQVSESESSGQLQFIVTLTGASSNAITVYYDTTDGTALAGVDYTSTSGMLTFLPATDPNYTNWLPIVVPVLDDAFQEPDETFTVQLSNPSYAELSVNSQATGTIEDDDGPPEVFFSQSEFVTSEGHEVLRFFVELAVENVTTCG